MQVVLVVGVFVVVVLVVVGGEVVVLVLLVGYIVMLLMVGMFYCLLLLGVVEFVKVGDMVKEGQMICIIEVMKLFNEIEVDKVGVIKEILIENGQVVEYG